MLSIFFKIKVIFDKKGENHQNTNNPKTQQVPKGLQRIQIKKPTRNKHHNEQNKIGKENAQAAKDQPLGI